MAYKLKGERTDLAKEFRACPYGRHSPELDAALGVLRMADPNGKLIVVCTRRGREWAVAHLEGEPPHAVMHHDLVFSSIEEAEWSVFKRRWQIVTGVDLDVD